MIKKTFMGFYKFKNCYSAQIESAGFNLRIGHTCMGYALPNWHRPVKDYSFLRKRVTPISFGINHHSAQGGRWYRFRIELGALQVWFLTKGDGADKYSGFHVAWRGLKNWRLLI